MYIGTSHTITPTDELIKNQA